MRKRFSRHFSCWNLIKKINLWTFDSRRDKKPRAHHSDSVSHSQLLPALRRRLSPSSVAVFASETPPATTQTARRLWSMALTMLQASEAPNDDNFNGCCSSRECNMVATCVARPATAYHPRGKWAREMQLQDAGLSCVPHELQVSAINLFQHEFNSHRVLSECSLLTSFHFPLRFTSFLLRQTLRDFTNSSLWPPSSCSSSSTTSICSDACVHLSVGSAL